MAKANGRRPAKKTARLPRDAYEKELFRLQAELVTMQEWVRPPSARIVVIFEGRDAAGKGSTIQRVTRVPQPARCPHRRAARTDRAAAAQWYFQRYVEHLPAGGEIVLMDRCWYNRAGVERVMGFCTRRSTGGSSLSALSSNDCSSTTGSCCVSTGSRSATRSRSAGSVRGSTTRCAGGSSRRWILSRSGGGRTTRAPRTRCSCTPTPRVALVSSSRADDKRRARINMIAHLLTIDPVLRGAARRRLELPPRPSATKGYIRPPRDHADVVPDHAARLDPRAVS